MVVRESNIFFYRCISPGLLVVFFGTFIYSTILIKYKYVSNTSSSTSTTYKIVKPLFLNNTKHGTERISVRDTEAAATFATIQSATNNKPLIMNDTRHDAVNRLRNKEAATVSAPIPTTPAACAVLFFGVPRLFRLVAFSSNQKYILDVNAECDVFVHTYNVTKLCSSICGGRGNRSSTISSGSLVEARSAQRRSSSRTLSSSSPLPCRFGSSIGLAFNCADGFLNLDLPTATKNEFFPFFCSWLRVMLRIIFSFTNAACR